MSLSQQVTQYLKEIRDWFDRGVETRWQDQTTPPIDLYFINVLGAFSTIAVDALIDDMQVTVASDASYVIGQMIGIFSATNNRFYFGTVLTKPGGNVLTLDTPLDFAFKVGSTSAPLTRDMNVDGSVTSQTFQIRGGGPTSTLEVDITRIILEMTTTGAPAFIEFGDLAALTNGIVLRRNNGVINNIFNAKTNAELANLMYDLKTFDAAQPFNVNGLAGRMTFGSPGKHGTVIRLSPGDTLDLIIQDDLSDLLSFRIIAQGHVVEGT